VHIIVHTLKGASYFSNLTHFVFFTFPTFEVVAQVRHVNKACASIRTTCPTFLFPAKIAAILDPDTRRLSSAPAFRPGVAIPRPQVEPQQSDPSTPPSSPQHTKLSATLRLHGFSHPALTMIPTSCARAVAGARRTPLLPRSAKSPHQISTAVTRPHGVANIARITRRWNNSPRPSSSPLSTSAAKTTIPGPTWVWLEPIYGPFRAYGRIQQRRPYMTQFVSALVIYFVGDLVAQSIGPAIDNEGEEERGWLQAWGEDRDWARTARALVIGGAAAVPGYRWFLWLLWR
jgi:hypothetical protein